VLNDTNRTKYRTHESSTFVRKVLLNTISSKGGLNLKLEMLIVSLTILAVFAFPGSADILEDLHESFKDEDIGYLNPETGMSPGVPNTDSKLLGSVATSPAISLDFGLAEVAGRWTLTMTDSSTRNVDMTLAQYGDVVFGRGTMISSGMSQEITIAGSVDGSLLDLSLVTVGGNSMYRFESTVSGESISGIYNAYSVGTLSWTGTYYGSKYVASTPSTSSTRQPISIGGMSQASGVGMG